MYFKTVKVFLLAKLNNRHYISILGLRYHILTVMKLIVKLTNAKFTKFTLSSVNVPSYKPVRDLIHTFKKSSS